MGFGYGSSVVGAVAPFGMVRLSPDTFRSPYAPFYHFSGYYYDDPVILGFSHLHFHGTGAQGYGNLLIMPIPGFTAERISPAKYRSRYDKRSETATPGYYSARLDNGHILAELSTTGRVGLHRYTFPNGSSGAAVIIDAAHMLSDPDAHDIQLTIDPEARRLYGHHRSTGGLSGGGGGFDLYWVIAFDQPLSGFGGWQGKEVLTGVSAIDSPTEPAGAYLEFDIPDGGVVNLRVGLSLVDLEGAQRNLDAEAPEFDFNGLRRQTEARWESMLSRVRIAETDPQELTKFYTSAYHSLIEPTVYSDVDGRYVGFDDQIHRAEGFEYYSDLSLWDTFRTLHPWLTLVYPEVQRDIIVSLLKMYEQDGFLPIWPSANGDTGTMIGASAELVIADSYVKGLRNYDVAKAYEAVTRSGREPSPPGSSSPGRRYIADYLTLGYVPAENSDRATSMTMEYAASDGALSQFAREYGREDDALEFEARSRNYRNHWDPDTRFFRARLRDGSFKTPFDPNEWGVDYTEATAWQYLWYAPHDPAGLMQLFGGREPFLAALEDLFARSEQEQNNLNDMTRLLYRIYYWQGNEIDLHTAYLFNDAGRPDLMGKWTRWILRTQYGTGPDGLPGNDDCGTMSSWYLFTTLGLYPIPGYDRYYVGAPRFPAAEITLPGGTFHITARGASEERYIPSEPKLNGRSLDEFAFRHTEITDGGTLDMEMR